MMKNILFAVLILVLFSCGNKKAQQNVDISPKKEVVKKQTQQEPPYIIEARKVDGEITGIYLYEDMGSKVVHTLFKKGKKNYMKLVLDDMIVVDPVSLKNTKEGTVIEYIPKDSYAGEYFILTKSNKLDCYNKTNEVFATGDRIE
jgi:hypothetical protein